jgi:hypothetical protein
MICCVYGFSDKIGALQFEWAWQHPLRSRLVRAHCGDLGRKRGPGAKFELLCKMLSIEPWCKLPLTLHITRESLFKNSKNVASVPPHMTVSIGGLDALGVYSDLDDGSDFEVSGTGEDEDSMLDISTSSNDISTASTLNSNSICGSRNTGRCTADCTMLLSSSDEDDKKAYCIECRSPFHIHCLARLFLREDGRKSRNMLLPSEGKCPTCGASLVWAEVVSSAVHFSKEEPAKRERIAKRKPLESVVVNDRGVRHAPAAEIIVIDDDTYVLDTKERIATVICISDDDD